MSTYKLYGFGESGNSYKVALMLELCGSAWTPCLVDYFNGETRSQTYRSQINEMGEVPVLARDARKWAQSGAILHYLSEEFGRFGGQSEEERYEILRWILFDNHKFTSYLATLRFLLAFAKSGENEVTAFLRARAIGCLSLVNSHMSRQTFLVGERATIADLSLCGYLFYTEAYGIDFANYPNIDRWLQRIRALPGWKAPYELVPRAPEKRS